LAAFCEDIKNGHVWNLFMVDALQEDEVTTEHRIVDFQLVHTVSHGFLDTQIAEWGAK
jgi:hypothetical protein